MCGIVGEFNIKGNKILDQDVSKMLETISHRGPDYQSIWWGGEINLGHALLKIQDISNESRQPMESEKYVMSYNGEIYNYNELRIELVNENFKIHSNGDTEVLLKSFEAWGIKKTLEKLNGFFAIALWDKQLRNLYLIRDKMGIKPLYYWTNNEKIVFGSEIKAILKHHQIKSKYDLDTLMLAMVCNLWTPHSKTMFKDIHLLEQGTYLKINQFGISKENYFIYKKKKNNVNLLNTINDFDRCFNNSINMKTRCKVPYAAFLSGGIDSSLVCNRLSAQNNKKLDVYTVIYEKDKNIDYSYVEKTNNPKLKIKTTVVKELDFNIGQIDKTIYAVEELLHDKVYVSLFMNYQHAKSDGYRVILSGQGADELWQGYLFSWDLLQKGKLLQNEEQYISNLIDNSLLFKGKIKKHIIKRIKESLSSYLWDNCYKFNVVDDLEKEAILSMRTILNNLLLQEDKLAMANSIECRVPFVDNFEIVELSMSTPEKMKIHDNREKFIIRKVAERYLPEEIVKRQKLPFQEPDNYGEKINVLVEENWHEIINCYSVKYIIQKIFLSNIKNFTDNEKWILLVMWRFEKLFYIIGE